MNFCSLSERNSISHIFHWLTPGWQRAVVLAWAGGCSRDTGLLDPLFTWSTALCYTVQGKPHQADKHLSTLLEQPAVCLQNRLCLSKAKPGYATQPSLADKTLQHMYLPVTTLLKLQLQRNLHTVNKQNMVIGLLCHCLKQKADNITSKAFQNHRFWHQKGVWVEALALKQWDICSRHTPTFRPRFERIKQQSKPF